MTLAVCLRSLIFVVCKLIKNKQHLDFWKAFLLYSISLNVQCLCVLNIGTALYAVYIAVTAINLIILFGRSQCLIQKQTF